MAVSPEDLAAGALALQVFIKNAKNVEIIVDVAFGAIPSILGIGAAGLLGSGIINTAREVRNSISLIRTLGYAVPVYGKAGVWAGTKIWSWVRGRKNKDTTEGGKKEGQETQDKQEGRDSLIIHNNEIIHRLFKETTEKKEG